jgi:hypothetical protein
MNKALLFLFILAFQSIAQNFVHPLDFKDTKIEREKVISYIISNVKETCSRLEIDDPATLRIMEKQELEDFKKLTKAQNRKLLDKIIEKFCGMEVCIYSTILIAYNQELSASKEKLEW